MLLLKAYVSPDGRIRTDVYGRNGMKFCIAEATGKGTLITEFNERCEVTLQKYGSADQLGELGRHVSNAAVKLVDVVRYERVVMPAKCSRCGAEGLHRELDSMDPSMIREVPVVPIFSCTACGQRHYSMTDEYLESLAFSNRNLFTDEELKELDVNSAATINTLKEYIIRIFASKKINRAIV